MLPVLVDALELGGPTTIVMGVGSVGLCFMACGLTAFVAGIQQRFATEMPSGTRMAVAANILFLAFFALELSDRLVRRDGEIIYWTTFLILPTLLLFCSLLTARRWAWWTSCGIAALGVLWFLGFVILIPFANIQTEGVPTPWYGRVYMICLSLIFASVLACAFWSIGRLETRIYFGLVHTRRIAVAELSVARETFT